MAMPMSAAGQALGLGGLGRIPGLGDALQGQTTDAVEELRKKRMLELQQRQLLGPGGGSAAASSLFGSVFSGGLSGGF